MTALALAPTGVWRGPRAERGGGGRRGHPPACDGRLAEKGVGFLTGAAAVAAATVEAPVVRPLPRIRGSDALCR